LEPEVFPLGICSALIAPAVTYGSYDLKRRAVLLAILLFAVFNFESAVTLGKMIWCYV